jgi:hypothetical protein
MKQMSVAWQCCSLGTACSAIDSNRGWNPPADPPNSDQRNNSDQALPKPGVAQERDVPYRE